MNTDAPWPDLDEAELRVLEIQTKLHQWAADDPHRRFCDLFNLVCDPAVLLVAWDSGAGKPGGTDGRCRWRETSLTSSSAGRHCCRATRDLKARQFAPLPVREKLIPKSGGKLGDSASPPPDALCKPPSSWCSSRSSRRTSSR